MFGKNIITGQKAFADQKRDTLLVTSMFFTLQGEGMHSGLPAMFIRLAKCNLNCSFCDAYFDRGDELSFAEIFAKSDQLVDDFFEGNPPGWARNGEFLLVVTGGEPLIQKNIEDFLEEATKFYDKVQIESNGTVYKSIPTGVDVVISPKCSEKTGKYLAPNRMMLEQADALKFVVSADPDSPYHNIPEWAEEFDAEIYISPMNVYNKEPREAKEEQYFGDMKDRSTIDEAISFWTPGLLNLEENQKNHEYAGWLCIRNKYKLNLQAHLYCSLA